MKNFEKSYYTWNNSKEAIKARTQAISVYLTKELQDLNVDTIRTDIPVSYTHLQSAYDVSKESLKNNIGLKFAFRSTDINEIKQTLEFFGIDKDDENNQKRLREMCIRDRSFTS